MLKKYLYINILLLLYILNLVYSYEVRDITPGDSLKKLYKGIFPCYYRLTYLCIETNLDEQCDSLSITFDGVGASQTLQVKNETASIIQVDFAAGSVGNYTATINSVYSVDLECMDIDFDSMKLTLKRDYYYIINFSYMGIVLCALYDAVGVPYSNDGALIYISSNSPTILQNIPYSSNFLFQILNTISPSLNINNITATFNANSKTKQFQLETIGKNMFDHLYDFKVYPDLEYFSNFQSLGIYATPVLSFKSNNTALSNSYMMKINGFEENTQTSPIGGNQTSTTYYYSLNKFGEASYELLYINNGQIVSSAFTINTNFSFYSFSPYNYKATLNAYSNDLPVITYGFNDSKLIEFPPLSIQIDYNNDYTRVFKFPFGFSYISPNGYKFNATSMIKPWLKGSSQNQLYIEQLYGISFGLLDIPFKNSFIYNNTLQPSITGFESIKLFDDTYLFRFSIQTPYRMNSIALASLQIKSYGKEALVSGDLYDGVYEFSGLATVDVSIEVRDIYEGKNSIFSGQFYKTKTEQLKVFKTPSFVPNIDIYSVYNVSFLYNNIDITNRRHYNIMYFNYPDNIPKDLPIIMIPIEKGLLANPTADTLTANSDTTFYAKWDESIQQFKIEFYIEPNSQIGEFTFSLAASLKLIHSQTLDNKLIIKNSGMDFLGPMFRQIKKIIPPTIDSNNKFGIIGWTFEIEDTTNGFDYGHIIITGELDKSTYNISLSVNDVKPDGNLYLGEYDVTLNISAPCISQNYIITEVVLFDRVRRKSMFSIFPSSPEYSSYISIINPFMYHLNDSSINKVPLTCATDPIASTDTTPPILSSFTVSNTIVDVSATNRQVTFTFTATDNESGIKNHQYPIVYLNTMNNRILECKSSIVSYIKTSVTYSCTIQLPISFGYPDNIILSVYNFVNNNGYSSGYSTAQLIDSGLQYYINTTFNTNEPSITSYFRFRSTGGDLFLNGRCFDSSTKVNISYYDGTSNLIEPTIISSTVIKVPNIPATTKQFNVYVKTSSFISNTITVTPTLYDFYLQVPTPTFPPTVTPVPTNSPQQCPGNPICGGPSNGKCIANQGCVCYSPWIGIDCLSQIIVVNPPIINTGNHSNGSGSESDENGSGSPSIEIIVPGTINNNTNNGGGNNNNNTTPITYTSLISIVAIREVDIYGGVVKTYTFKENWLSRQLDTLTYAFYTSIEDENKQSTNITAILKWFTNQTTISFADEELTMNPSSMKYTIEIGYYPFSSSLNQLQLVMSALIQSNTTENICSVKEFGETTSGDNSNYLKIQVDNHSLYGRFIRRGIVDSNIRTITNVLLDKDMNPITSSKSLQSYIGIQIPNYKETVIIDPDFSVILDSYSASSKSNSICSSKSKLSTGKIVGIALGAAAFAAVVGISFTYYIIRKREDSKFLSSMNNKMNQINKT